MGTDDTRGDQPNGNSEDADDQPDEIEDVDHTHPDSDESFTDTGVYDREKKHPKDTDDG